MKNRCERNLNKRNVLIGGSIRQTVESPEFVLVKFIDGIWYFLCCNSIMSLDVNKLKKYWIERYTKEQVLDLLDFMSRFGGEKTKNFLSMKFDKWLRKTKSKSYCRTIDCVEDRKEWYDREVIECKNYKARCKMKKWFAAKNKFSRVLKYGKV